MKVLIIGAGPTGLTAALELTRRGVPCRIVDRKEKPSFLSRAVGINPHSLRLLERSGVTQLLLDEGLRIRKGYLHGADATLVLRLDQLPPPYDFLLSLPQDRTESLMLARLAEMYVKVEFGTTLTQLRLDGDLDGNKAHATLTKDGSDEEVTVDYVIGADGAHSKTRELAGIPFDGYDRPEAWSIADVDAPDFPWPHDAAHLFLRDGQVGFIIPIGPDRYRAVATTEDALARIPGLREKTTRTHAANSFRIAVRQARQYRKGPVFLAGDAAHTHTPAGALGMNTGIADACDLAARIAEGRADGYHAARHRAGRDVIRFSETLVRVAKTASPVTQRVRKTVFKLLNRFPVLQRPLLRRLSGAAT